MNREPEDAGRRASKSADRPRRRRALKSQVGWESLERRLLLAAPTTGLASALNSAFINNTVTSPTAGISTNGTTTGARNLTTIGLINGTGLPATGGTLLVPPNGGTAGAANGIPPSSATGFATGTGASILGGINVVPITITQPVKTSPFGPVKILHTNAGAAYEVAITSGPGIVLARRIARDQYAISLLGTNSSTQVAIVPKLLRGGYDGSALRIGAIDVRSGQIGSIQAGIYADLTGPISPLNGQVAALSFNSLGADAQIRVNGPVGGLTIAGNATLGPKGRIIVPGPATIGGTFVNQGFFASNGLTVGGDLGNAPSAILATAGPLTVGGGLGDSGALSATGLTIGNNMFVSPGVSLSLPGASPTAIGGDLVLEPGSSLRFVGDLTQPLNVNGSLVLSGGALTVDRDAPGGVSIGRNLIASGGGALVVGRNLGALAVGGDLNTSLGGQIQVGGNADSISIQGAAIGKGTNDLNVGLSLFKFQVLGGSANQGGVQSLDLLVGKTLRGIDIPHGLFRSFISAGVAIDGSGSANTAGGNIGADGVVAVYDSTIMAGARIVNFTVNGDVKSDQPTNPAGLPTRILAGVDRQGNLEAGGLIDNLLITGSLTDSVIAASVKPKTGTAYSTPPTGTIDVGYVNGPHFIRPNFTSTLADLNAGYVYQFGRINPSFSPTPLLPGQVSTTLPGTLPLALPSQPTIDAGVFQTSPHVPGTDYAGLYATDTSGVIVGLLPKR